MAKSSKTSPKRKKVFTPPSPGSALKRQIEEALGQKEYAQAGMLATEGSRRYPTDPEFYEMAVEALMVLRQRMAALLPLHQVLLLHPNRAESLYLGMLVYGENQMYAHAVRCARRLLELHPDHIKGETIQSLILKGDGIIKVFAEEEKLPFEPVEEAEYWKEEGSLLLSRSQTEEAILSFRKAVAQVPSGPHFRLLLAEALFQYGQIDDAEAEARKILELDPQNVPARLRLMFCARARYDDAALQAAYEPLKTFVPQEYEPSTIALAQAHGLAGDHEKAYAVVRKITGKRGTLPPDVLFIAGAAAANVKRANEARGYYRLFAEERSIPELDALEFGLPGPGIASSFPYIEITELMNIGDFSEAIRPLTHKTDEEMEAAKNALQPVLQRQPQILWLAEKFTYEEDSGVGMLLLSALGSERALSIIRGIIESQTVPWGPRYLAALLWIKHGYLKEGETIKLWWNGGWKEATKEEVLALEIDREYPADVNRALEEAYGVPPEHRKRAERILRHAIERHPDIPILYHNLAVTMRDSSAESERLLRRAVELDPNYIAGRTSLANFLAITRRPSEAEELLAAIPQDQLLQPDDYIVVLLAKAVLAQALKKMEESQELLREILRNEPEHELARNLYRRIGDEHRRDPLSPLNVDGS